MVQVHQCWKVSAFSKTSFSLLTLSVAMVATFRALSTLGQMLLSHAEVSLLGAWDRLVDKIITTQ